VRNEKTRVIGTLLGVFNDGCIEITDCFGVPHAEKTDEFVKLSVDYHKTMYTFHRRINKKEEIVGWFTTRIGEEALINDNSSVIHEFYSHECVDPIHLVVDTTLTGDNMGIKAFTSQLITIGDQSIGNMFREIKVQLVLSDAEITCLSQMIHNQEPLNPNRKQTSAVEIVSTITTESDSLQSSLKRLLSIIDVILQYNNEVLSGQRVGNPEIGIQLLDMINALQIIKPDEFQNILNNKMQDLLMVSYLSSLIKTQLNAAERLLQIL